MQDSCTVIVKPTFSDPCFPSHTSPTDTSQYSHCFVHQMTWVIGPKLRVEPTSTFQSRHHSCTHARSFNMGWLRHSPAKLGSWSPATSVIAFSALRGAGETSKKIFSYSCNFWVCLFLLWIKGHCSNCVLLKSPPFDGHQNGKHPLIITKTCKVPNCLRTTSNRWPDRAKDHLILGQAHVALLTHSQLAVSRSSPKKKDFSCRKHSWPTAPLCLSTNTKASAKRRGSPSAPSNESFWAGMGDSRVWGKEGHSRTHTDCRVTASQLSLAEWPTFQQRRSEPLVMVGHGSHHAVLYKSFSEDLPVS